MVDDQEPGDGASEEIFSEVDEVRARIVLRNKIDLSGSTPGVSEGRCGPEIRISAKTGAGLTELKDTLKACVGYNQAGEGAFTARRRHLEALATAQTHARAALAQLKGPRAGELVAEDLRCMQQCLGEITGAFSSDDLLDRIFSSFCIGK
jgi:tRNA modification GTPase